MTIHNSVGSSIDLYAVKYFDQVGENYTTSATLFIKSGTTLTGTSVLEISQKGIPLDKIVVFKPVTRFDAYENGFVPSTNLGSWALSFKKARKWNGGIMYI